MITKKKKSSKIFITRLEFSSRHYLGTQMDTDMYYVGVANRILPILQEHLAHFPGLTPQHFKELSLMLTAYIEDLVAQHGIWSAFVRLCRRKYHKDLPLFPTEPDNFIEDEPTEEAVRFLLWYRLNDVNPETLISPATDYLTTLASTLIVPLFEAFDAAPDTPGRVMLRTEEEIGVPLFIQVRNYCSWLLRECYLTKSMWPAGFIKEGTKFFNDFFEGKAADDMIDYAFTSYMPFNVKTGPLAITPLEWMKEIMEYNHAEQERQFMPLMRTAQSLPYQYYRFASLTPSEATVEDMDGNTYRLSAESMPDSVFPESMKEGEASFMSIVRFGDSWIMNGAAMNSLPAETFTEAQTKYEEKKQSDANAFDVILNRLGGQRLGVLKDIDSYMELMGLDKDHIEKNKEGKEIYRNLQDANNLTYFLNKDSNVSMIPDVAPAINIPGNEFFDPKATEGFSLIMDREVAPVELSEYLIDNNIVPGAAFLTSNDPELGHRIFQDNIRFFLDLSLRNSCNFVPQI